MELERRTLHKNKEIGRAFSQITLDDDYNLPDYKPDLTKVIKERGQLHFDEVHNNSGHVWFKGSLAFEILYRTDLDNSQMNHLKGEIPFQETLSMDGIEETDSIKLEGRIEDISVSVINSRKLSIRALVEFQGVADRTEEICMLTQISEGAGCEVQREELDALELLTDKKDTLRVRNEISLSSNKPNMDEILWSSVELRGISSQVKNKELEIMGEALVYVLYSGTEEEQLQWFETTVPVKAVVECNSCDEKMITRILTELAQKNLEIQPDEDGEPRKILLEMVINLTIYLWKEEKIELISDLYALNRQLKPELEQAYFQKLLIKNEVKCKIAEKVEIDEEAEDVLQICVNEVSMVIEQTNITDQGVLAEGILIVEILYMTSDESMKINSKRAYLPFSQMIEMPMAENPVKFHLDGVIEQVTTLLADNRTIDVKAMISLNLLAFEEQKCQIITDVEEEELDIALLQQSPGIVGYIAREGDSLFGIAKENHTTVAELMQINHLSGEKVKSGEKILIVKKLEMV